MQEESYAKDESVKEEPSDDEAECEVNCDEKMPSMWTAIVDPDRLHGRLQTTIRIGKSMNWRKPLGLIPKASESARIVPPMRSKFALIRRSKGIMFEI